LKKGANRERLQKATFAEKRSSISYWEVRRWKFLTGPDPTVFTGTRGGGFTSENNSLQGRLEKAVRVPSRGGGKTR